MSDLEAKLRSLNFREPPPGVRAAVLALSPRSRPAQWFGPHPLAWLALAAVWLALAVLDSMVDGTAAVEQSSVAQTAGAPSLTLLAFYQRSGAVDPAL